MNQHYSNPHDAISANDQSFHPTNKGVPIEALAASIISLALSSSPVNSVNSDKASSDKVDLPSQILLLLHRYSSHWQSSPAQENATSTTPYGYATILVSNKKAKQQEE